MRASVLKIINTILENKGGKSLYSLKGTERLREDLSFTSIDLAELTVKLESEFGIDIFTDGIVHTVNEIYKKLES